MSHEKIHEDQLALRIMYLKSEKEKKKKNNWSTKNSNLANYSSRMKDQ